MLLDVRNLTKTFQLPGGETMTAVKNASFTLEHGQTLALVGESGSGKSTLARLVLRLHEATAGEVTFDGVNVLRADQREMRHLRSRMQIVFQDPFSSLLPHYSALDNVAEPLRLHKRGNKQQRRDAARDLLERVGVSRVMADRYPYEFSGGQQQRIAIARALALQPELLVCDEPTSSLDVSIQAQILNLLQELQGQLNLAMLFISHNLAVVEHLATHVAVMYRGRIVEMARTERIFTQPQHAYTKRLLAAVLPARGDALPILTGGNVDEPLPRVPDTTFAADDDVPLAEIFPGHFVAGENTARATGVPM